MRAVRRAGRVLRGCCDPLCQNGRLNKRLESDVNSGIISKKKGCGEGQMKEQDTLKKLIDDGRVTTTLHKGSAARHAITALQTMLHWLGFDHELKWTKYGADGDYGQATVSAVAEFARRNGSTANGERITEALATKVLARYDCLEELKQLAEDVYRKKVERHYKRGGCDRVRISALQTLLHELGFDNELNWNKYGADGDYGRSTNAAVAACSRREGFGGDGQKLMMPLAEHIVTKLRSYYGDSWHNPSHTPTPVSGSLSINSVTGSGNRQYFKVSDGVHEKRFRKFRLGLFTTGKQKPADFVKAHVDELRALRITQSEINVMIAVAENEGNLDAINTWDSAFLSFGLFQWTAGQGSARGELPGLLARIKSEDHDLFDKYCGQYGLDVLEVTPGQIYGYFSLGGVRIKTPAAKEQLRQAAWAFHFWRAGQDPAIQAMEVKHALARLEQFYNTDNYKVDNRYRVSDLITSEYGVGLILDNHVNRPAYVKVCLAKALAQSGLQDPERWGTDEERQLIDAYLKIRMTHGRSPMTDAEKRARVTKKYLRNGTISDQRGSFKR
ncbi:MAG: peptidoglycan-binding protein [Gammaproteobacteria bacterium]|nr:peptidoglycan-binding protein [Gammaproteobacteria bacterium]